VTFGLTWREMITRLGGIYECCDHDDMLGIRSGLKTVIHITGCHLYGVPQLGKGGLMVLTYDFREPRISRENLV